MNKKIALLFGATGLTGNMLLEELLLSGIYEKIKIFIRNKSEIINTKVEENVIDFSSLENYSSLITGDDLYIALGSTLKKAGSVASMEITDRDLPVRIATIAKKNGVKNIAVVSSVGANSVSSNYYLRIKGEMEEGILNLFFDQCVLARPSLLLGKREEKRTGESMGKIFMKIFSPVMFGKLKKYKGIHARDVAKAMIAALQKDSLKNVYESDELQTLADNYSSY